MPARSSLAFLCVAPVLLAACSSVQMEPKLAFDPSKCPVDAAPPAGEVVIARFYEAFGRHDLAGMLCNYDPDVEFTDSIFGTLKGKRAFAMWAMLVPQGKDLAIQSSEVRAAGDAGHAHWNAQYTFSFLMFGNKVENSADATFELRNGKIVRHRDVFDLPRWMHMALWPLGGVISESTIKGKVQARLDDFIETHPEFQESAPPAPQPAPPAPQPAPPVPQEPKTP